jgi:ubiquitin-activating enzyme E1
LPKKKKKLVTEEKLTKKDVLENTEEAYIRSQQTLNKLPKGDELKKFLMNVVSFEKDDDKNFHIDFITAASNLRAMNYGIPVASRLESKIIAGRIIPAIVTTTACVVGFMQLELYKFHAARSLQELRLDDFKNTFINLALPLFRQADPLKPKTLQFAGKDFTQWTRIDVRKPDCTLKELIEIFQRDHNVTVDMLGVGQALIFASWMMSKAAIRLPKKITEVVEEVTQKKIDPTAHYIMLDPTATDEKGNDVENLPLVCLWLK